MTVTQLKRIIKKGFPYVSDGNLEKAIELLFLGSKESKDDSVKLTYNKDQLDKWAAGMNR